jgi:hypothetical protein
MILNVLESQSVDYKYQKTKPGGDWGVRPKSGPNNRSGGVQGSLVNGNYDVSLACSVELADWQGACSLSPPST